MLDLDWTLALGRFRTKETETKITYQIWDLTTKFYFVRCGDCISIVILMRIAGDISVYEARVMVKGGQ